MLESLVRSLLYYPVRLPRDAPPPSAARGALEVWISISDGNEIHGLHWPAPEGRPTILFFHGNAQSVFEWALIREELVPLDCGLLLVDYPGYGKSAGSPSESALYAAGQATYTWLTREKGVTPQQIIVMGKSLGGGVGSKVVLENPAKGLILESTFSSIPAVAKNLFPFVPVSTFIKSERYDTLSRLGDIHVPVLVVHGTNDEVVPFPQGQAVYDAANEPKQFYIVEHAGHNDVSYVAGAQYGRVLRVWLDGLDGAGAENP